MTNIDLTKLSQEGLDAVYATLGALPWVATDYEAEAYRVTRNEVYARKKRIPDNQALDTICDAMNSEWSPDTLDYVAQVLGQTGRAIKDSEPEQTEVDRQALDDIAVEMPFWPDNRTLKNIVKIIESTGREIE